MTGGDRSETETGLADKDDMVGEPEASAGDLIHHDGDHSLDVDSDSEGDEDPIHDGDQALEVRVS